MRFLMRASRCRVVPLLPSRTSLRVNRARPAATPATASAPVRTARAPADRPTARARTSPACAPRDRGASGERDQLRDALVFRQLADREDRLLPHLDVGVVVHGRGRGCRPPARRPSARARRAPGDARRLAASWRARSISRSRPASPVRVSTNVRCSRKASSGSVVTRRIDDAGPGGAAGRAEPERGVPPHVRRAAGVDESLERDVGRRIVGQRDRRERALSGTCPRRPTRRATTCASSATLSAGRTSSNQIDRSRARLHHAPGVGERHPIDRARGERGRAPRWSSCPPSVDEPRPRCARRRRARSSASRGWLDALAVAPGDDRHGPREPGGPGRRGHRRARGGDQPGGRVARSSREDATGSAASGRVAGASLGSVRRRRFERHERGGHDRGASEPLMLTSGTRALHAHATKRRRMFI